MPASHATVTALHPRTTAGDSGGPVLVIDAIEAFLATPRCTQSANTRRVYGEVLRRAADLLGSGRALVDIDDQEIAAALTTLWGDAAPATWNRNRAVISSWLTWCEHKARWSAPTLPATCERRRQPADHTRAVDASMIDRICTRRTTPYENDCSGACSMRLHPAPVQSSHSTSRTAISTTGEPASLSRAATPSGSSGVAAPRCFSRATYAGVKLDRCSSPTAAPACPADPRQSAGTSAPKPDEYAWATTAPAC
jgi:hypothetical protein